MSCSPPLPKKAQVVEVKQGDTLMLGCQALDAEEDPVPLTDVTVAAQLRTLTGELVFEFEFEPVNLPIGTFELWRPDDGIVVEEPGDYLVDIQYSAPYGMRQLVRSSRNFYVRILTGVTA